MSEVQKLQRTGQRLLAFHGQEIAYASNKTKEGETSYEWTTVRVFTNEDRGGYVVGIGHLTCMTGKRDVLIAEEIRTIKDAVKFVRQHKPELEQRIALQLDHERETMGKRSKTIA